MSIIDGKEVSKIVKAEVKAKVLELEKKPKLLVVLVGDNPASQVYVASKEKASKACGIIAETIVLDKNSSEDDVIDVIKKANADKEVNAILVQLPLPEGMNTDRVINNIAPEKDVDGLTIANQGKMMLGQKGIVPCTPKGIIKLLKQYNVEIAGKNAIVIGRSILVGKPVAQLLLNENATVTIAHSKTKNLKDICKNMDIIVAAVGKPRYVTNDMVKEGAVIIDVGINRTEEKLVGDVDFDNVYEKASLITPVPGGVGPMTIACLMENVLECYEMQQGDK